MHVWVQLSTKDIASNALRCKKVGKKLIQSGSKNFLQARLLLYMIILNHTAEIPVPEEPDEILENSVEEAPVPSGEIF